MSDPTEFCLVPRLEDFTGFYGPILASEGLIDLVLYPAVFEGLFLSARLSGAFCKPYDDYLSFESLFLIFLAAAGTTLYLSKTVLTPAL